MEEKDILKIEVPVVSGKNTFEGIPEQLADNITGRILVMSTVFSDKKELLGKTEWKIVKIKEINDHYLLEIEKAGSNNSFSKIFNKEELDCILANLNVSKIEDLLKVQIVTEEEFPLFVLLNLSNGRGSIDC